MPESSTTLAVQPALANPTPTAMQVPVQGVPAQPVRVSDMIVDPQANATGNTGIASSLAALEGRTQLLESAAPFSAPAPAPANYVPITQPLPAGGQQSAPAPMQQPMAVQQMPATAQVQTTLPPAQTQAPVAPVVPVPQQAPIQAPMPASFALPVAAPQPAPQSQPLMSPVAPPAQPMSAAAAQLPTAPVAVSAPAPVVAAPAPRPVMAPQPNTVPVMPFTAAPAPAPAVQLPPAGRPMVVFSTNTQAVWQARRSIKALYIVAFIGLGLVIVSLVTYWISIGSPTSVNDLPFMSS